MAGFSTSMAQAVLNHFFRRISQPVPAGTYLALFVADPTDNNVTSNEVTGTWYARQDVSSWAAPISGGATTSNSNQISFDPVTTNPVTVTHWGLYDAATSGNLMASNALSSSKTLNIDDVFTVNPGELVLDFQ